ncbi:hypothetical protein OU995_07750 [Roseateles sp. SL47]|uniref:EscI/YscI/HrpB family type III secretion system inner rod protein n=1 Tax=Roseateles sp. SL47 TaxID=2995138 RepID=UPI00226F28FE|nr:EscI/YscI/HrpB family type III secretion system inner rod protein [Roseateles sp. SL47]WAC74589.1 hypothetical protein OU995_07750 [Roseateles sp. SL47]
MSHVSYASKVWSSDGEGEALADAHSPASQDVMQFQQWLQTDPASAVDRSAGAAHGPSTATARGAGLEGGLSSALHHVGEILHQREQDYFKTLERAARTGDPVEGLAVQRRLSELYLDHGLAVKVIAKTAQAAESLMRLQ